MIISDEQLKHNPKNLLELYSGDDLELLFKGGFINFGYWSEQALTKSLLKDEDVINANISLYQQVFQRLRLQPTDRVLEVGSGHGSGAALLTKVAKVEVVYGVDVMQQHVNIAIARNKALVEQGLVQYVQGKAEDLPFPDNYFSKIYTIEAFQHFNVHASIASIKRALAKDGIFVISTFFVKDKNHFAKVLEMLPRPAVVSDNDLAENSALPEVLVAIEQSGLELVSIEKIGDRVWPGYDKWVRQSEPGIWDKNWLVAYENDLLDYYIVKVKKPCD